MFPSLKPPWQSVPLFELPNLGHDRVFGFMKNAPDHILYQLSEHYENLHTYGKYGIGENKANSQTTVRVYTQQPARQVLQLVIQYLDQ